MKPLSSLFLMIMLSFSTVIAANLLDPTSTEPQDEITVDETIKNFIKDLCKNLTLDDYIHHKSGVEALKDVASILKIMLIHYRYKI